VEDNSDTHGEDRIELVELESQVFLRSPDVEFLSATFDNTAKLVVTGSGSGMVRVWAVSTGEVVQEFSVNDAEIWKVRISSDGQYILYKTTRGSQCVWSTRHEEVILELTETEGSDAEFLANTNQLVFGGVEGPIRVWGIVERRELSKVSPTKFGLDFMGSTLSSRHAMAFVQEFSGEAHIFDLMQHRWVAHFGKLPRCWGAFSNDGTKLVTCTLKGLTEIWDTRTGKLTGTIGGDAYQGPSGAVSTIWYGDLLGLFTCATPLRFWDIRTRKPIPHKCPVEVGYTYEGEFSADGRLLVFASDPTMTKTSKDGTTVWRVRRLHRKTEKNGAQ